MALLTSACVTTRTEYLPVYLEQHPERPAPPDLSDVDIKYQDDKVNPVFTLTPEELDDLNHNNIELEKYIELLIGGWKYYERATTAPTEDK